MRQEPLQSLEWSNEMVWVCLMYMLCIPVSKQSRIPWEIEFRSKKLSLRHCLLCLGIQGNVEAQILRVRESKTMEKLLLRHVEMELAQWES